LVEPQPEAFERLKRNYCGPRLERLILVNAAISSNAKELTLYRIDPAFEPVYRQHYKPTANASGITSPNVDHVRSFLIKVMPTFFQDNALSVDDYIETLTVPALGIRELIAENRITRLDFVQIDCEGYDAKVVHQVLDARDLVGSPALINFESKNLSADDYAAICGRLERAGYQVFTRAGETRAIRCPPHAAGVK
jgi:FkbM family methyltransferase